MAIYYPPASRLEAVLPRHAGPYVGFFLASGQDQGWPAELLAGLCWRESFFGLYLHPADPSGTGDGGFGRGLMQVDARTWIDWCALKNVNGRPLWQLADKNIQEGAVILSGMRTAMSSSGVKAQVAAYNAGPVRVFRAIGEGADPDTVTTGKDYASAVLGHATTSHSLVKDGIGSYCTCCLCLLDKENVKISNP